MPPDVIGNGIPEREISKEPEEVMDLVEDVRNGGNVNDTFVTVPVPDTEIHPNCGVGEEEMTASTWPSEPILVNPVPPDVIGKGV